MEHDDHPDLAEHHLAMLRAGSGISDQVIRARGYRTITDRRVLAALGFSDAQCRVPGLLLPLHATDGSQPFAVYRPDTPRSVAIADRRDPATGVVPSRAVKYEMPAGTPMRVDCPPPCRLWLADPAVSLWITEGQKKADALASRGLCAIALLGVWNWRGTNAAGGKTMLADFDLIAWNGRAVRIVFDSDLMTKQPVRQALDRLTTLLQLRKAQVTAVYLPAGPDGDKQGVDDYLAAGHTTRQLEALAEAPRPEPRAAPPVVELLDGAAPCLARPLALLDGHAYAATWLPCRVTLVESASPRGQIVRHDPPLQRVETRLFVIAQDGRLYGEGGDLPLDRLGIDLKLTEVPPPDATWSAKAINRYRRGDRPAPAGVFARLAEVVDRFIDFDRSLGSQHDMAAMIACYILATWFLDAFNVIGFLWPNGDRGCGKTQLLTVVARLAYLGEVILAGGSYPALRDLADYGACLAFDDAENMADPRRSDPDKRALLLAGNRRGNTVPVKELVGDKKWVTRRVHTYCPRLFSATRLPDAILESRSIVVPLIRTVDRYRANADPADAALWPHDRRALVDDLWALALANLPALPLHETAVNQETRLTGRSLEPWRPILAVARWLSENGEPNVYDRMQVLAEAYQDERPALTSGDLSGPGGSGPHSLLGRRARQAPYRWYRWYR